MPQPRKHHQSIVLGMRAAGSLRAGDKFYVSDGLNISGHRREVMAVTFKGPRVTILCSDTGTITVPVTHQVALVQDME